MKYWVIATFIGFATTVIPAFSQEQPNVVFFLVDDLGLGDVGCFGSTFHETPHIDQLAADGMKFTQAYSACTVCSPSRAAILLGKYPGRIHLTDWIAGHKRKNPRLKIPDWNMRMEHKETTLAEAMSFGGYRTQFIGKWHLMPIGQEDYEDHYPTSHGFDSNIGGRDWGQPKGPGKFFAPFGMPNLPDGETGDFLTDALTEEAIRFIDSAKQDPFFLFFSYYTVHGPIMAPPELVTKYKKKAESFTQPYTERVNPAFAGMMELLDESVGRVRAHLRKLGLDKNTLIVFTADNGGTSELASAGLRGAKALSYEGGTRVSTIVSWPGITEPGSECDVPVIGNDFYPTLLEAAGLDLLPEQHLDAQSLVPLLKGKSDQWERDELFWHYPHYHRTNPYGAIRKGDFKLIEFFEDGVLELYDLRKDPAESQNLAASQPEKVQGLLKVMKQWRASVGAQMPIPNPVYDPDIIPERRGAQKSGTKIMSPVLTAHGEVSASSNQSINPVGNSIDGNRKTRWAADGESVPQWIQLNLGEARKLAGVDIYFKNPTWVHYRVEVSNDGKKWKVIYESKSQDVIQDERPRFDTESQFLRVTVDDLGSGWVTISEWRPVFAAQ